MTNKHVFIVMLAVAMLLATTGCNVAEEAAVETTSPEITIVPDPTVAPESVIQEEEEEEQPVVALTEEDLLPYAEFYDIYIVQMTEEEWDQVSHEEDGDDPLSLNSCVSVIEDSVIDSIEAEWSDLDGSCLGTYDVSYIVVIDMDIYNSASSEIEEEVDAQSLTASTEEEAQTDATLVSSPHETQVVYVTKSVHVVSAEDYTVALEAGDIQEIRRGVAIVGPEPGPGLPSGEKGDDPLEEEDVSDATLPGITVEGATSVSPAQDTGNTVSPIVPGVTDTEAPVQGGDQSGDADATTATPVPTEDDHEHEWVAQTVEDGYYEEQTVVDEEAWTETVLVYVCNTCGYETQDSTEMGHHCIEEGSSFTSYNKEIVHDAVTHEEEAWVDTSYVYYVCSICGAVMA